MKDDLKNGLNLQDVQHIQKVTHDLQKFYYTMAKVRN